MQQRRPDMRGLGSSAPADDPNRFFLTMIGCSALPMVVTLWLPEPWYTSVLPVAAFMLIFTFFFGLALALHWLGVLWRLLRPVSGAGIQCWACQSYEQPHLRFGVVRVAPGVYRIRCPECGERWVERR